MKKIYYSLALLGLVFASCHPMNNTYKSLDADPAPGVLTYTLLPGDYKLVPTSLDANASKQLGLTDTAEANKDVPAILNLKFPGYGNGSRASITYSSPAVVVPLKLVDSSYLIPNPDPNSSGSIIDTAVVYTLTTNDYFLLPGNKYTDFSVAQLLSWLPYKYANAQNGTLKVLTWTPYPATLTVPSSFLYVNGSWRQIYQLTPAQYASVGHGTYNEFTSADDANIASYINELLKADLSVAATAKTGDMKFVSYYYYASSTKTYQRVITLYYNGTNWTTAVVPTSNTSTFVKSGGTWAPDPTVYYTLTAADCTLIANSTIGGDALATVRANLAKYNDFEMGQGQFTTDLVNQALILVLTTDFKTPKVNVNYNVTYLAYTGKDVATVVVFHYDGTQWDIGPVK